TAPPAPTGPSSMSTPLYRIPGTTAPAAAAGTDPAGQRVATPGAAPEADAGAAGQDAARVPRTVAEVLASSQVEAVLDELDRDLVGLAPVKQRIRDIAALLVIDKLRLNLG